MAPWCSEFPAMGPILPNALSGQTYCGVRAVKYNDFCQCCAFSNSITHLQVVQRIPMQNSLDADPFRPLIFRLLAGWCLVAMLCSDSFAQTVSASSQTAKVTASIVPSSTLAIGDETFALADGLVRELRNGGYVIYLRHGPVLPNTTDKSTTAEWWKDCQNTQRISPETQAQMRVVAEALTRQRIAVNEVLTSEFCRAYDTAGLLGLAPPQRIAALNDLRVHGNKPQSPALLTTYAAGIQQLFAKPIPPKPPMAT